MPRMPDDQVPQPLRVLIADDVRNVIEYVDHLAAYADTIDIVGLSREVSALWDDLQHLQPDVLVLSAGFGGLRPELVSAGLRSAVAQARLVVLTQPGEDQEFDGADEVLPTPAAPAELVAALRRAMAVPVQQRELMAPVESEDYSNSTAYDLTEPPAYGQLQEAIDALIEPGRTPGREAKGEYEREPGYEREREREYEPQHELEPETPAQTPLSQLAEEPDLEPIEPVRPRRIRAHTRSKAEVFIVFSGKGGVGKSVIASNLAVALSSDGKSKVALIDLDLQFGDIAVMLHVESHPTSIEALAQQGELVDAEFIEEVLATGPEDVRILIAPASPEYADLVTTATVRAVLREMSKTFDYIVVDAPAHLEERTLEVIEMADQIVVVTAFSITAVKDTKITLKLLQSLGVAKDRISIVLNQTRARVNFPRADIEDSLRFRILTQLPFEPKVEDSVDQGKPIFLSDPKTDWVKQFRTLVDYLRPRSQSSGQGAAPAGNRTNLDTKAARRRFSLGRG